MSASWWAGNLAAYSAQVALVVAMGGLAAAVLRLKQPRVMLAYWRVLLAACLLLPLLEPWQQMPLATASGAATNLRAGAGGSESLLAWFPPHVWILLVLGVGMGLGLLRLALGLWRLSHYRRTAHPVAPLPGALRQAQAMVGVEPAFYSSDRVGAPVTFGWLDPVVIFPRQFEAMDEGHQRAIACHELLHVARRDWLMNLFEEFILAFFWFHPAIWWVVRSIRLGREQVVDGEVVALTGARKSYLHALLEIAGTSRALPVPAPLFLVESQLAQRVAALVKEVRMSRTRLVASLVVALAIVVAMGWWGVKTFRLTAAAGLPTEHLMGYGSAAAPGSSVPSTFMFYKVEGDIEGPVPIYQPGPPYTPQARKDKVQGTVVAAVDVDEGGNVVDVKLTAVSLSKDLRDGLDESVMRTLRIWKFTPGTKKGKPVPVTVTVEVSFRLF